MRNQDFSQVIVRGSEGRLSMVTVEGITKWLADNVEGNKSSVARVTLDSILPLEPPGCFIIMSAEKTIFDAFRRFHKFHSLQSHAAIRNRYHRKRG